MNRLILLRHGLTQANLEYRYCGSTDLPLQPQELDAFLQRRADLSYPDPMGLDVVTSGMRRTEQTLRAIYGDLPHRAEPAFREIDFGAFEMKTYEELKDDPVYRAWCDGDNEANVCPNGESGKQMTARVLAALHELRRDTLLVTHGGVIAAILAHLFPSEEKNRFQWQPKPYTGYEVTFTDGQPATWRAIP